MKCWLVFPFAMVVAACGGGEESVPPPTMLSCMTPKSGVRFETEWKGMKESTSTVISLYSGSETRRFEVSESEFEGRPALRILARTEGGVWSSPYQTEHVAATAAGFQQFSVEGGAKIDQSEFRLVYSPPLTTPASLTAGVPVSREYTVTHSSTTSGGDPVVNTWPKTDSIEFLGYERVEVADGHVLGVNCKVRISYPYGSAKHIRWYAPGYGLVAEDFFDSDGTLLTRERISKVIQAP